MRTCLSVTQLGNKCYSQRMIYLTKAKCENCGETFTALRWDARTCSPRCRVALHRKKWAGEANVTPRAPAVTLKQLFEQLDSRAKSSGTTRAALLRRAIEALLAQQEQPAPKANSRASFAEAEQRARAADPERWARREAGERAAETVRARKRRAASTERRRRLQALHPDKLGREQTPAERAEYVRLTGKARSGKPG